MEIVLRAAAIYLILLGIFRASGKRTLAQLTAFDFILLLIVSEATQQALLGDDFSVTTAVIVVLTLVCLERLFDYIAHRSSRFDRFVNDGAIVIVEHGTPIQDRMDMLRVSEDDVLEAARMTDGIERLDQIKYAVLERNGGISVVPAQRG